MKLFMIDNGQYGVVLIFAETLEQAKEKYRKYNGKQEAYILIDYIEGGWDVVAGAIIETAGEPAGDTTYTVIP